MMHPLRAWRLAHDFTLEQAGTLFGVPASTISRWEQGHMNMNGPGRRLFTLFQDARILSYVIAQGVLEESNKKLRSAPFSP
jgi:transcriptional regulator with XRE-family HTH domain